MLYCSSTAYTHGYLGHLGLDADLLDRNFHQIIYHGFIMNILTIVVVPWVLYLLVEFHSGCILGFKKLLKKSFGFRRKVAELKKCLGKLWPIKTRESTPLEKKYNKRSGYFLYLLIGSSTFFGYMIHFEAKGRSEAETLMEAIKENTYSTIRYQDSEQPLAYLYCGSRNCAGLNVKTEEIKYFPQSVLSYKKAKQSTGASNAPKKPA